jgi:tetratricopeptide (TPR) repeat protein
MLKRRGFLFITLIFLLQIFLATSVHARTDAEKQIDVLNDQAALMYRTGRFSEAIPLLKKALAIAEKHFGPNHKETASMQQNLAMTYHRAGDFAHAEPLFKQALVTFKKTLGPNHKQVASTVNSLAKLYLDMGDYARAEPLLKESLALREKILGPNHKDVATSLNDLAQFYKVTGDYKRAEKMYKRAAAIYEKALGPNHTHLATVLYNLANLYRSMGDYKRAEPLYQHSLAIREKALGSDHPEVALSLGKMGIFYEALGDYDRAESLYKRALSIYEKKLGPDHPDVGGVLISLAGLYKAKGEYDRAESTYKRALAIYDKKLPDHPNAAAASSDLGLLYKDLGDYKRAEKYFRRALAVYEKTQGPNHPNTAATINNLAILYHKTGQYEQAESLYKRAMSIVEKAFGPNHPNVAGGLNNLGTLCVDRGDYRQAATYFKRALSIVEKTLGPDHPYVAMCLYNLGGAHKALGDYGRAAPLYERSLTIRKKILGPESPAVASSLSSMAQVYAAQDRYAKAHGLFKHVNSIDYKLIRQVMEFTSEEQKMEFLATKQARLEVSMCLAVKHLSDDETARKDALDWWLQRKGIILEAQKQFQEALVHSDDPQVVKSLQELGRVRAELSKLVFGGPGPEGPDAYQRRIADLEKQRDALEAKLIKLSQSFARQKKTIRADTRQVAGALPKGAALLEIVRISYYDFKAVGQKGKWLPDHYLAFVLHAGKGDQVGLVDLGLTDPINKAVAALKKTMATPQKAAELNAASLELHRLVFAPIQAQLGKSREIFLSPDGDLNLIPFEVLQGSDGKYLIENYTFNYLASGRDMIGFGSVRARAGKSLLLGDPNFNASGKGASGAADDSRRSADLRGIQFGRLPGTLEEVKAIQKILGPGNAVLKTGKQADETALFQTRSPQILHLATHGFFLTDQQLDAFREEGPHGGRVGKSGLKRAEAPRIENPLLRSGLALAGANQAISSRNPSQSGGLLTAEKVLSLRLEGTDLVVLSACETGLGEVRRGEGVYGLRRAFVQAGTKGLVMSMWSVPDKETMELMTQFYTNLTKHRLTPNAALRKAALAEMKIVKDRYGQAHPLFWGAFIYLGEPTVGGFKAGGSYSTTTAASTTDAGGSRSVSEEETGSNPLDRAKSMAQRACFVRSTSD